MVRPPDIEFTETKLDNPAKGGSKIERRASRLNQISQLKSRSFVSDTNSSSKPDSREQQVKITTTLEDDEGSITLIREEDSDSAYGGENEVHGSDDGEGEDREGPEDFESHLSMRNYHIEVSDQLVERCATQLSHNTLVVSREVSELGDSRARKLALQLSQ